VLAEHAVKSWGPYTRNVLSDEPAAIKVPRGFQEIDRKLKISKSSANDGFMAQSARCDNVYQGLAMPPTN
jgi:hypothetical protein